MPAFGEVAEWSNAAVSKTVIPSGIESSNLSLSAILFQLIEWMAGGRMDHFRSSVVSYCVGVAIEQRISLRAPVNSTFSIICASSDGTSKLNCTLPVIRNACPVASSE